MAQWNHQRLPSCGSAFESQAQHQNAIFDLYTYLSLEYEKNENKQKEAGIGPFFNKVTT